jgi:hypothetical protein
VERYHPEGTFKETSMKNNPDYRTHPMFDRDKRWEIHFLQVPKAPPGCVSDIDVYGLPCPEGVYHNLTRNRCSRLSWIYNCKEPKSGDIGKRVVFAGPVYRTENTHRTELD